MEKIMKSEGGFRKEEFQATQGSARSPLVSVITVVFNNSDYIEKTILSVLNQTFRDKEYIIIDGASTDGTLEIIEKFDQKIDFWQSQADKGIYDAMNKGLSLAKGTYVLFLNSGDLFSDDYVLENVFSKAEQDADIYYGETNLVNGSGEILGTRSDLSTRKLPLKLTWKDMKYGMVVSHQSIFVRRSIAPVYDLKYRYSADIEWVIESLKRSRKTIHTHTVISNYLIGGLSIKHQKRSWQERFDIFARQFGLISAIFSHFFIAGRSLVYKLRGKPNY